MKLPDHVDHLRKLITNAFDKQFSRLGVGPTKELEIERIPQALHARRERFQEMLQSHIAETGSYVTGREKLIDELTFTLFNRIAAVKVMEAASLIPPIITKQAEHGGRSFGHKAWLETRPDMRNEELEGIREYIQYAFNELGETLPLYRQAYPFALLPDAISLNEIIDAFNAVEKDPQVESDIWQSDDVLGWLYESYNTAKKEAFKASGDKTEYDKVSLQSQVYTPRWVVKFLVDNSLGKLYLEMYPDSEIKKRYKIANAPAAQIRKRKPLHEVTLIDPASGSGNFLLYAFDLFYDMYLDQIENYGAVYDEDQLPQLIIEHNLHGIDLDDRAVQLAQLGLYIKARKKRQNVTDLQYNVVSSDFYLPDYEEVRHIFETGTQLDPGQRALIADIWGDLQNAYKFGSLIRLDEKLKARLKALVSKRVDRQPQMFTDQELGIHPKPVQQELFLENEIKQEQEFTSSFFSNLKAVVERFSQTEGNPFLATKTRDAIIFLELLNQQYSVATTNPPYTVSGNFGSDLKIFIEDNYKKPYKFHVNLYASFLKRCYELTEKNGRISMIHPHTFMFIKSFEGVRKFIVKYTHIDIMVDFGLDRVNLFGPEILLDATFYVLSKVESRGEGLYFDLTTNLQEKKKKKTFFKILDDFILGKYNSRVFTLAQSKLKIIKTWPFIYWISDEFRGKFGLDSIETVCPPKSGMATAQNIRFLRFWWELEKKSLSRRLGDEKHWVRYSKGGPYKKWYGNLWLRISWKNQAQDLRNSGRAVFRNEDYYFKEGITYSASGSKGVSFRYLPENCIYDVGGASLFPVDGKYLLSSLALLNSKLSSYIIACLNPTVNTQVGDIERVPFAEPSEKELDVINVLSQTNIEIRKEICRFSIVEDVYAISPLERYSDFQLTQRIKQYLSFENHLITHVLINEAVLNEMIYKIYELSEHDHEMVISKEGESVGCLPVCAEAREAFLVEKLATKKFSLVKVIDFINSIPAKEYSVSDRKEIEAEFSTLYQKNNGFEEFCEHHQVNPINVWYWFKQSNIIPEQRMNSIAMEFLAVLIREALMEDEDGVIPLVPKSGGKTLLECMEEKFQEKGFSTAQFSQFDSVLGRSIGEYLNHDFFQDLSAHLNLFMYLPKTPFIWHLSSGPEQGFDCYTIIYKWSRDKLMRIRSVYIENRERALINRQSDLAGNDSAEAQNEKDKIFKQLKEIEIFKAKIDELLAEGYDPQLDDGVGKNIAPLQKKKMIPYDVLTASQLKKYLNADW
jgi:hypothetical protein